MRFALGQISLSNIAGGTLTSGSVPWVRSKRTRVTASNAGIVTLIAGASTTVVSNNLGTVVAGDIIECQFNCTFGTGTAAIGFNLHPHKSAGTATVQYAGSATEFNDGAQNAASSATYSWTSVWGIDVTVGGTLTLDAQIFMSSTGNGNVAAGAGTWDCIVYAGS